jgi:hypothetical protein
MGELRYSSTIPDLILIIYENIEIFQMRKFHPLKKEKVVRV